MAFLPLLMLKTSLPQLTGYQLPFLTQGVTKLINQIKHRAVVLSLYLALQLARRCQTRRQVCVPEKQLVSH